MSQLSQLFNLTASSERNFAPNTITEHVDQKAIDVIKEDFIQDRYILPFQIENDVSDDQYRLYYQQMLHFYIRDCNIRELTPFYQENIKTGYVQTLVETIIDGVLDGSVVETLGTEYLDPEASEDLLFSLIVHGRVLVTKKLDKLSVLPPYRYFRQENGDVVVYYYTLDNQPLKEIYSNQQCQVYKGFNAFAADRPIEAEYYELTMRQLVTDGMLELAMLRSLLYTLMQSDLWGGSTINFIDEQYLDEDGNLKANRVAFVPTQTVENMNPDGATIKPLFETVTPEIRDSEFESILNVIDNTMATLMGMTAEIMGSGNATESNLLSAKTSKRFNKLKVVIQYQFNEMYKHFGIKNEVNFERFRADSDEVIIKNAVLVAGSNVGTVLPYLNRLYPKLTDEELEIIYLKGEIKSSRVLTEDERLRAIELKLITEEPQAEPAPPDQPQTESEVFAQELTPIQGVADQTKAN